MEDDKDLLMYFHSSLRNVGLFTSISLALQAYSSRAPTNAKKLSIYFAHLIFLILAIYLNYLLIQDVNNFDISIKILENRWMNVPYVSIVFLVCMFMMNFTTFLTKTFKLFK